MIFNQKEYFDSNLKAQLQKYVYDVVGLIQDVYKELPNGMPEYVYQEALARVFEDADIKVDKEYKHHPVFRGKPLESFIKMDLVIPRKRGNIIIECKAVEKLTNKEYQQLFSYMHGTGFPIGILVNFHSYPRVQIHKFYYDRSDNTITTF